MDELDDALMDIMNDFTADGNDIRKLLVNPKFHDCKLHWSEPTSGSSSTVMATKVQNSLLTVQQKRLWSKLGEFKELGLNFN